MSEKKKKKKKGLSIGGWLMSKIPVPLPGSSGKLFVGVNKALNKAKKPKK